VLAAELADEPRVEVVAADAAAFDFGAAARAAGRPVIAVGNLPYQIASALIVGLVAAGRTGAIARAIVMVQREMAKRIIAPPGSRVYGRLTVAVAQHAEARILFDVKPGSFHPAPAVISSVLSLVPRAAPQAAVRDPALFDEVVKRAFATRRKMLRRALAAGFGEEAAAAALAASGIAGTKRAEELSVAEFARLADAFSAAGVAPGASDA
jgi:16S rRNA (adenine1518-N6/adenine1519-N6)-dimethyltransferase